MFMFLLLLKSF